MVTHHKVHCGSWRLLAWSIAGALLVLPLLAMQFTDEVNWDVEDFLFAATAMGGTGLAFEKAVRVSRDARFRLAAAIGLAGLFLLVWISMSVGLIGDDGHPANLLYLIVPLVGLTGSFVAGMRAGGMVRVMLSMAATQLVIAGLAIHHELGQPWTGPGKLAVLTGFFIAVFLFSAWMFHRAAAGNGEDV